jgi:glucosamine--fructose-6-phosphate aminotransferase (isomerizing)
VNDDEKIDSTRRLSIKIPDTIRMLMPILTVIPLQLLAYHVAVKKGLNVDQPRNLAKSVTVE